MSDYGYNIGQQTKKSYTTGGKITVTRIGAYTEVNIESPREITETYNKGHYSIPFVAYKYNYNTGQFEDVKPRFGRYYLSIAEHDNGQVSKVLNFLLEAEESRDKSIFLKTANYYISQFEKKTSYNPFQAYSDKYCGGNKFYTYTLYFIVIVVVIIVFGILYQVF